MAQSAGRAAIVPKGDWSASVAYTRLDAVVNNNILYIAKIDVPSGTPLTDTTYWFQSINGGEVPIATTTTAGKVKPDGTTITIDADGTIHGSANVNIATTTAPGIVKPDGTTITVDPDGTIRGSANVDIATASKAGIVKPDGTTITVANDGTIAVNGPLDIADGGTGKASLASTNYTTLEYRGESLNSSGTTPTVNGTIAWTYS